MMATTRAFAVLLWDNSDVNEVTPTGQTLDVEAGSAREACRIAAREWGLKPHEWCFDRSPYRIGAHEKGA